MRFTRMYRYYLFGRKFIVHTDQQSLIWLLSFRCPQDQLARWLEELSQYHMVIHQAADIVVRMLCPAGGCCTRLDIHPSDLPCGGCPKCTKAHEH